MKRRFANPGKYVNRLCKPSIVGVSVTLAISAWTAAADATSSQLVTRETINKETASIRTSVVVDQAVVPLGVQAVPRHTANQPSTPRTTSPGMKSITLPNGKVHLPELRQLGGAKAKVPMKHDIYVVNGNEIGHHVLATLHGNLNVPARISMSCPQGRAVSWLSYQVAGHNQVTILQGPTQATSYVKEINIQPFTAKEFEKVCHKSL
ncbi:MAG TPA: hypothetical protein ENJ12_02865, partial [Thiolapillus brandeum]|nr:hypothetical protein [Thiolapillus brandeum]